MVRAILVVVLALVLPSLPAVGLDSPTERKTLKGLPGVHVLVEEFSEGAKRAGFDRLTFQTDVELKLRTAGIKVLSKEERISTAGGAYLYVNVNSGAQERGEYAAFSILLALNQYVRLSRDPSVLTLGATWLLSGNGEGDAQFVRAGVKDLVDRFINAWLSVNPKE